MCKKPITLPDRIVACGGCIECLLKRSYEWAFRLEQEAKTAQSGVFITLTYDDANAIWIDTPNGETKTTLIKSDLQKFIRACRQRHFSKKENKTNRWNHKPRYFSCGEYGTELKRAHYHVMFFNLDKDTTQHITHIWKKGYTKQGPITTERIKYITNYMLLKSVDLQEGQIKPFTLMSKKPILGANYVINNYTSHHENQDHNLHHGSHQEKNLYRCYDKKIFTEKEREAQQEDRKAKFQAHLDRKMEIAEMADPLDPLGWIKEKKDHKEKLILKRQKRNPL